MIASSIKDKKLDNAPKKDSDRLCYRGLLGMSIFYSQINLGFEGFIFDEATYS